MSARAKPVRTDRRWISKNTITIIDPAGGEIGNSVFVGSEPDKVAIYEDGVQRPVATSDHTGSNVIEFNTDTGLLYGYNSETTDFGFRSMTVDASGVTIFGDTGTAISGFGWIYSSMADWSAPLRVR